MLASQVDLGLNLARNDSLIAHCCAQASELLHAISLPRCRLSRGRHSIIVICTSYCSSRFEIGILLPSIMPRLCDGSKPTNG